MYVVYTAALNVVFLESPCSDEDGGYDCDCDSTLLELSGLYTCGGKCVINFFMVSVNESSYEIISLDIDECTMVLICAVSVVSNSS